jgi:hypothetical protein
MSPYYTMHSVVKIEVHNELNELNSMSDYFHLRMCSHFKAGLMAIKIFFVPYGSFSISRDGSKIRFYVLCF